VAEKTVSSEILLLHLADLHAGNDVLPWQRGASPESLLALSQAVRRARSLLRNKGVSKEASVFCAVAGDLTVRGSANDFLSATQFLSNRTDFAGGNIGLGLHPSQCVLAPGNHDHWDGKGQLGALPLHNPGIGQYFKATGRVYHLDSSDKALRLEILCLDSSSGHAAGTNQASGPPQGAKKRKVGRRQGGRLSTAELSSILKWSRQPQRASPFVVRTIMLHHDLEDPRHLLRLARAASLRPEPWPLHPISRNVMIRRAARHGVCAAFTGHQHSPHTQLREVHTRSGWSSLREFRAPTCAEGDLRVGHQGFLAHHLKLEDASVTWTSHAFLADSALRMAPQPWESYFRFTLPEVPAAVGPEGEVP